MARHSLVPEELKASVFTVREAREAGLSRDQLRSSAWRKVARGWYHWVGCPASNEHLHLVAIAKGLPPDFAFSGSTAARLHGLDCPSLRPEVSLPRTSVIRRRVDAEIHRVDLPTGDVVVTKGFPLTSPARTCFDLASRLSSLTEAVVVIDAALHRRLLSLDELRHYVAGHARVRGVVNARRVVEFAEPKSESPMETRLRMLLVLAGPPRPEAQAPIHDEWGREFARLDLYYDQVRLGIEYDGENHRDRMVSDNRRQNRLQELGISLLRYTGPDLRERSGAVIEEVRRALGAPTRSANANRLPAVKSG